MKKQKYSFFNTFKSVIKEQRHLFYMIPPFILMDLYTRIAGYNSEFYNILGFAPILFNLCWIVLFLNLSLSLKKKIGKKIYLITSIFFFIIFLTNNIYYSATHTFFSFNLLEATKEGLPYIISIIKGSNPIIYLFSIIIILLIIKGYKSIPYKTKNNYQSLIYVSIWCLIIHIVAPIALGQQHTKLTWDSWQNLKNIYINFNDSNKSMSISGLFEYTFRDFYITYLKPEEKQTKEEKFFLDKAFEKTYNYPNLYTGIFKNKNLIFVQLEGIDNWLLTEKNTPTLYNMMKNSINFENHYSYYTGGGSTFNSEFAVNTGFITPISYTQNAYTFNKNSFPYSMPNLFKQAGYTVNVFHMNKGEYYSRETNYKNWGYDNYYGLLDIEKYNNENYTLDRELILNKKFNNLMFPTDKKFVDYIITYSTHYPFKYDEGVCNLLLDIDSKDDSNTTVNIKPNEEICAKRQAKETDYMMKLLLENLEEKNLIDNTVIVVFTDHYLFTLNNQNILKKYKNVSNNLINHTPFFIWTNNIDAKNITEVTSQLNILPTTLNLFGLSKNNNNYIGKDALSPLYEGLVFFSDYSWYDGNVYVKNGKPNKKISQEELTEKNNYISYLTKKNDLALKFNYFDSIK